MNDHTARVWTDGSGTTGGPAGIAYVALIDDAYESEESLELQDATNQQAEILAAAYALHRLDPCALVEVVSDSEYLVKGWNEYPQRQRKKNLPHWQRLTAAVERHTEVRFQWTRGHDGTVENERADRLAGEARRRAIEAQQPGLLPEVREAVNRARVARGDEPLVRGPSFHDPISAEDDELLDRIGDDVFNAPEVQDAT